MLVAPPPGKIKKINFSLDKLLSMCYTISRRAREGLLDSIGGEMNRYKIEWKNTKGIAKSAICIAPDAKEAIVRYGNRKIFGGNSIFFAPRIKQFSADDLGLSWAQAKDNRGDGDYTILASKI